MKQKILSHNAPQPIGPYSQAIKYNNILVISGQIGINPKTGKLIKNDIVKETKMVMENIKSILLESACTFDDVVKCSIFLSDMTQFNEINKIYGEYFQNPYPARETIEVKRLPKNVNIEISAIAICK